MSSGLPHAVMAMMTTARRAVTVMRDAGTRAKSKGAGRQSGAA